MRRIPHRMIALQSMSRLAALIGGSSRLQAPDGPPARIVMLRERLRGWLSAAHAKSRHSARHEGE